MKNKENQKSSLSLDDRSFEMLFKSNFKDLCHLAVQYVKDSDTAKDIVQEVFFNVWKKKADIDLSRPVRAYLTSSVRNRCINYLRDHKKLSDGFIEREDQMVGTEYKVPDKLIENELKRKIADSIDELPDRCKEVFVLSRYENLKYLEIAERLQISVKTVETQMSKALQHLRSRLGEFLTILMFFMAKLFGQ